MPTNLTPTRPDLRTLTPARVSLPTAGETLATSEVLAFQLAHAQARDAVYATLHLPSFAQRLTEGLHLPILQLRSNAPDRATYLRNPGLGRTLHPDSAAQLTPGRYDLSIILTEGLSALALERHAVPVLATLLPSLAGWHLAPITLVAQGRVAIADPIGHLQHSTLSLILIGERPGLSSPDSLSAYLTFHPHPTRTDADRNCLSNIRPEGLPPTEAAARLLWYLTEARIRQATGLILKEGTQSALAASTHTQDLP